VLQFLCRFIFRELSIRVPPAPFIEPAPFIDRRVLPPFALTPFVLPAKVFSKSVDVSTTADGAGAQKKVWDDNDVTPLDIMAEVNILEPAAGNIMACVIDDNAPFDIVVEVNTSCCKPLLFLAAAAGIV